MNNKTKSILKILIFFAVGIGTLYLVYLNFNGAYMEECALKGIAEEDCSLIRKVVDDFLGVQYFYVGIALIAFMISNISRAIRWHLMLKPLGYTPRFTNSISAIMVAYLTNLGIPRSGEFVRAGILSKYEKIPAEKVMGTIVTDRIIDVLSLLFLIFLALFLSYETIGKYFEENLNLSARLAPLANNKILIASLILIMALIAFVVWKKRMVFYRSGAGKKIIKLLSGLWEGVRSVLSLEKPWLFLFHSVVIWAMYYIMTYLCILAFAPTAHLGLVAALVVFILGALGIVFPAPGGMGSYHYLIGQGLLMYGVSGSDAFSLANIIFFSVQIFCNIFFGIIALILLPLMNKDNTK